MSDIDFEVREALGRDGEEVVIFQIDLERYLKSMFGWKNQI